MYASAALLSVTALLLWATSMSYASTAAGLSHPSAAIEKLGVPQGDPMADGADRFQAGRLNDHFDKLASHEANARLAAMLREKDAQPASSGQVSGLLTGKRIQDTPTTASGGLQDAEALKWKSSSHADADHQHAKSERETNAAAEPGLQRDITDRTQDDFRLHGEGTAGLQREGNSLATNREKRSYDEAYMQSIGYDPLAGWRAKQYDDYYLQSLGYDPNMPWTGKRFDDSYMQSIGYDPLMAWDKKRNDDSFLQSVGYDPTLAWGDKHYDDSFLQSIGYDPTMAWGKRRDDIYKYNPARFYWDYMNKNSKNTEASDRNEDVHDENEISEAYFRRGEVNVEPILTKRSIRPRMFIGVDDYKRSPSEMGPRGFHEGIFNDHFGYFSPVKRNKRYAEKESSLISESGGTHQVDENAPKNLPAKRKFGMGSRGFHGDTFSSGFGDFGTMKKRYHGMTSSGFHGDTFSNGFGDFGTMKKRYNDMTSSGFYGDTFSNGFGDFGTMKKRYHGMTSSGFHGDTFSSGFGDFGTMKKRYGGMTSSGFHGDTFSGGFGDFVTMKKRFPALTPDDYRKAVVNHRLAVMLNNPKILRENMGVTSTSLGRDLPSTEMLPNQTKSRTVSANDDDESR
ncbi:hypothetical protein FHG87_005858 [Trinorchestia longiramus]|nr:hypothetical protein FHG87_005858 [Trinorchestia longiramus]